MLRVGYGLERLATGACEWSACAAISSRMLSSGVGAAGMRKQR
jgi:hypothetical protein